MRWLEFTQSVQFECEGRHKGPKFEKGERHHFEDGFADRWLRRAVAFAVEGPRPAATIEAAAAGEPKAGTPNPSREGPRPPPASEDAPPLEPKASPSTPSRPKSRGFQAPPDA